MQQCKICGRRKKPSPSTFGPFEFNLDTFEDDRELSHFLYRLTQDIIISKDFSDDNINRICDSHLRKTTYPNRHQLLEIVQDLKTKLRVNRNEPSFNAMKTEKENRPQAIVKSPEEKFYKMQDKNLSVQSLIDVPRLLLNEKPSSISTITTYDFPSSEVSISPQLLTAKHLSENDSSLTSRTALQKIFLSTSNTQLTENRRQKDSIDSSVDALSRMVAASRKPQNEYKSCPLGKGNHEKKR
ncbi:uncharacterized protein LOC128720963 [Anopheles nili]|uniref:uncharacterized protein LOC128720963 n=1 Tax=Anopheles nili TaxID=185578 RepID=UPI00237A9FDB|nr:uncharacterized protein LOC128720963 [Anopheles nili]